MQYYSYLHICPHFSLPSVLASQHSNCDCSDSNFGDKESTRSFIPAITFENALHGSHTKELVSLSQTCLLACFSPSISTLHLNQDPQALSFFSLVILPDWFHVIDQRAAFGVSQLCDFKTPREIADGHLPQNTPEACINGAIKIWPTLSQHYSPIPNELHFPQNLPWAIRYFIFMSDLRLSLYPFKLLTSRCTFHVH